MKTKILLVAVVCLVGTEHVVMADFTALATTNVKLTVISDGTAVYDTVPSLLTLMAEASVYYQNIVGSAFADGSAEVDALDAMSFQVGDSFTQASIVNGGPDSEAIRYTDGSLYAINSSDTPYWLEFEMDYSVSAINGTATVLAADFYGTLFAATAPLSADGHTTFSLLVEPFGYNQLVLAADAQGCNVAAVPAPGAVLLTAVGLGWTGVRFRKRL